MKSASASFGAGFCRVFRLQPEAPAAGRLLKQDNLPVILRRSGPDGGRRASPLPAEDPDLRRERERSAVDLVDGLAEDRRDSPPPGPASAPVNPSLRAFASARSSSGSRGSPSSSPGRGRGGPPSGAVSLRSDQLGAAVSCRRRTSASSASARARRPCGRRRPVSRRPAPGPPGRGRCSARRGPTWGPSGRPSRGSGRPASSSGRSCRGSGAWAA